MTFFMVRRKDCGNTGLSPHRFMPRIFAVMLA